MSQVEHRTIQIVTKYNAKNGLIAAFSDDLQGLLVVGKTTQEVERKLPGAVREILEAMGNDVGELELIPTDEKPSGWSATPTFRAEANLSRVA